MFHFPKFKVGLIKFLCCEYSIIKSLKKGLQDRLAYNNVRDELIP